MSRGPKNLAHEARKAAALFWARTPREQLTPDQRTQAYFEAMRASLTNKENARWAKYAKNMLPFEDKE